MKKLVKKQWGGPRVKVKEKSPSGNYVKVTKTYDDPNNKGEVTTTRRTVKGVLKGAPRIRPNLGGINDSYELSRPKNMERNSEYERINREVGYRDTENRSRKKGGATSKYKMGGVSKTKKKK